MCMLYNDVFYFISVYLNLFVRILVLVDTLKEVIFDFPSTFLNVKESYIL